MTMVRPHRLWTDDDDKLIRKLAGEKKAVPEIAAVLGRTELSVAIRCEHLGLVVRRRTGG